MNGKTACPLLLMYQWTPQRQWQGSCQEQSGALHAALAPISKAALTVSATSLLPDSNTARVKVLVGAHTHSTCDWPLCCQSCKTSQHPSHEPVYWLQVSPILPGDERGGGTEDAALHVQELHWQAGPTTRCAPGCPQGGGLRQSEAGLIQLEIFTLRSQDTRHRTVCLCHCIADRLHGLTNLYDAHTATNSV